MNFKKSSNNVSGGIVFPLAISVILVIVDQFTKFLAVTFVKPVVQIPLIQHDGNIFLSFFYTENRGAAFSMLQDKKIILVGLTSLFLAFIVFLIVSRRIKSMRMVWALAVILGGGVGNLIDRIVSGYVVDFISFDIINFAIFNFADICAVTGACMLLVFMIYDEVKNGKKKIADSKIMEDGKNE